MSGPFLVIYFILVTVLFFGIAGGCIIYLLMGIRQLVTGYKEGNYTKKKAGWITTIITLGVFGVTLFYYLRLIFS